MIMENNDANIKQEKIKKHNDKVAYNKTVFSWIVDILACLIFFPYIIMVIYRRVKYNEYIKHLH